MFNIKNQLEDKSMQRKKKYQWKHISIFQVTEAILENNQSGKKWAFLWVYIFHTEPLLISTILVKLMLLYAKQYYYYSCT